jgi:hypothetical protein
MSDPTDGKNTQSFRLNPELLAKVPLAEQEAIRSVECLIREVPWPRRAIEAIACHLAAEAIGVVLGGLVGASLIFLGAHIEGSKAHTSPAAHKDCVERLPMSAGGAQTQVGLEKRWLVLVPRSTAQGILEIRLRRGEANTHSIGQRQAAHRRRGSASSRSGLASR